MSTNTSKQLAARSGFTRMEFKNTDPHRPSGESKFMNIPNKLRAGLAACRRVQIDDTLHLHHPDVPGLDKLINKALCEGKTVTEHGVSKWLNSWAIMDQTKTGTNRYTWDKSGNRVKVERYLFTKDATGKVTKNLVGYAFESAKDHV